MYNSFDDLVKQTYRSSRKSLEGYYFFDEVKQAWFRVVKASLVFVSFEYSFGVRWGSSWHRIEEAERCDRKRSDHIMCCSKSEFYKLKA